MTIKTPGKTILEPRCYLLRKGTDDDRHLLFMGEEELDHPLVGKIIE